MFKGLKEYFGKRKKGGKKKKKREKRVSRQNYYLKHSLRKKIVLISHF